MNRLLSLLAPTGLWLLVACGRPGALMTPPAAAAPGGLEGDSYSAGRSETWSTMPFFIEVNQTTVMSGAVAAQQPTHVGANAYIYVPDSRILLINPAARLDSASGGLLIGANAVLQTPDRAYKNTELVAFPSAPSTALQIISFDKNNGTVRFVFEGAVHALAPGEVVTLKQLRKNSAAPMVIMVVTNHGRLDEVQWGFEDSSLP